MYVNMYGCANHAKYDSGVYLPPLSAGNVAMARSFPARYCDPSKSEPQFFSSVLFFSSFVMVSAFVILALFVGSVTLQVYVRAMRARLEQDSKSGLWPGAHPPSGWPPDASARA